MKCESLLPLYTYRLARESWESGGSRQARLALAKQEAKPTHGAIFLLLLRDRIVGALNVVTRPANSEIISNYSVM